MDASQEVPLQTARGRVDARFFPAPDAEAGVAMVGGVGGGWDSPAQGLYPRLARELPAAGVAALRVKFRNPRDLDEATADLLAGVAFLESRGIHRVGLVGHSFGGAVVIRAAAESPAVRAVVTLATQAYGAGAIARIDPRGAVLLVHGRADPILPPDASVRLHQMARGPKRLVLHEGAGHVLDEVAEAVHDETWRWLVERL